jgi:hypothetical protein
MPTPKQLLLATVALYGLAQMLPAVQGHLQPGDIQWPSYDPDCAMRNHCESMMGYNLSIGGLFAFLFLGIGFYSSPFAESSWLANPLGLAALVFFVTKKPRTAAWLAGGAVVAALLMLLPWTSHDRYGHTDFGALEIGYWCWLASMIGLFAASRSALQKRRMATASERR